MMKCELYIFLQVSETVQKTVKGGDGGLTPSRALGTKQGNLVCFVGRAHEWVSVQVCVCMCVYWTPLSDSGRVEHWGIDRALAWNRETVPGSQPASTVPLIDLHYLHRLELQQEGAGRSGPYTQEHILYTLPQTSTHTHTCTHQLCSHTNLSESVETWNELR